MLRERGLRARTERYVGGAWPVNATNDVGRAATDDLPSAAARIRLVVGAGTLVGLLPAWRAYRTSLTDAERGRLALAVVERHGEDRS